MASYREKFFNNTPSLFGKYRCQHCGNWFSKEEMDVDHIVPKSKGGTDALVNLQGLCKHCNRSKRADTSQTAPDFIKNTVKVGAKTLLKKLK